MAISREFFHSLCLCPISVFLFLSLLHCSFAPASHTYCHFLYCHSNTMRYLMCVTLSLDLKMHLCRNEGSYDNVLQTVWHEVTKLKFLPHAFLSVTFSFSCFIAAFSPSSLTCLSSPCPPIHFFLSLYCFWSLFSSSSLWSTPSFSFPCQAWFSLLWHGLR